jgi:SAM-dependent MidA family methyltransferase
MSLKQRIVRQIRLNGPISVADYMALCLFDPKDGYYTTREPFGAEGDFITAPEVSQMFGELLGAWCINAWQEMGSPSSFVLCEMGPGRGTLMDDLLRTVARLSPAFCAAARIHMVELSDRLAELQRRKLAHHRLAIEWRTQLDTASRLPLILVANELFDAIPTRQYVKHRGHFVERLLVADDDDRLHFIAGTGTLDAGLLPAGHALAAEGTIFEISPQRVALMREIASRIGRSRGAALLVDYGHLQAGFGDTLQALRSHNHVDVLDTPGEADVTTHVDFHALAQAAKAEQCRTATMTQGDFLLAMGLLDRAGALGRDKSTDYQEQIRADVERLAGPDQMGHLFKLLCVTDAATTTFPFNMARDRN